jgi:hypothetical protein
MSGELSKYQILRLVCFPAWGVNAVGAPTEKQKNDRQFLPDLSICIIRYKFQTQL